MSVNGMTITVPKNLQVQFPATFASWRDTANAGVLGSEVIVQGNVVDGKPIAALVQLSQYILGGGDGIISAMADDGLITLACGQKLRINDPNAVFSAGYTARPLFTADDRNPSVAGKSPCHTVKIKMLIMKQPTPASRCVFQEAPMTPNVRVRTVSPVRRLSQHQIR